MIISQGILGQGCLESKTVIVTGGAGGIGYECARALLWLGAHVVIADIDNVKGARAEAKLQELYGSRVRFFYTDVGCEQSVSRLAELTHEVFGGVYALINNATIAIVGGVKDLTMATWDKSYNVNLRGPIILTQRFLPEMLRRREGVVVFVSSSGAAPYLGGYEIFKTAQVELGNTLAAELENTGVKAFTIGPGMIKTETANRAISELAPLYGMTVEEFYNLNAAQILSPEAAGAGFAAAVAMADKYHGLEIGSVQALTDAGIRLADEPVSSKIGQTFQTEKAGEILHKVYKTLHEQVQGWYARNIFERQWMFRDFRKHLGITAEAFLQQLLLAEDALKAGTHPADLIPALNKLEQYYHHMLKLMQGYERNPTKAKEHAEIIRGWILQVEEAKVVVS